MGSVLISSEDFDRYLPPLPPGWKMTVMERGKEAWRCVLQRDGKPDEMLVGDDWSPHAAVRAALCQIPNKGGGDA